MENNKRKKRKTSGRKLKWWKEENYEEKKQKKINVGKRNVILVTQPCPHLAGCQYHQYYRYLEWNGQCNTSCQPFYHLPNFPLPPIHTEGLFFFFQSFYFLFFPIFPTPLFILYNYYYSLECRPCNVHLHTHFSHSLSCRFSQLAWSS